MLAVHQKEEVSWNQQDIRTMVSWFKHPGDSKLPSRKQQLLIHYEQTKNCSKNNRTYLKSGEHAVVNEDVDGEQDVGIGGAE